MLSKKYFQHLIKAVAACGLAASICAPAHAYTFQEVFKTEHFAINQILLDENETLDTPTQASITSDIQAKNRLSRLYQSTTVIFPAGSPGYTGKINTPVEAVLSISNFGSGKDRIAFNRTMNYSCYGGIFMSFEQIIEMINQRVLNSLLPELKKLPLVLTNMPVSNQGIDPTTNAYYITSVDEGLIIDMRIDDSVYYSRDAFYPNEGGYPLNDSCKVDVLLFVDRMTENLPEFISGRAAINKIVCPRNTVPQRR